jgi:hypothetical protein
MADRFSEIEREQLNDWTRWSRRNNIIK